MLQVCGDTQPNARCDMTAVRHPFKLSPSGKPCAMAMSPWTLRPGAPLAQVPRP